MKKLLFAFLMVFPPILSNGQLQAQQKRVRIPPHSIEVIGDMIIWETASGNFHVRTIYPSEGSFWAHARDICRIESTPREYFKGKKKKFGPNTKQVLRSFERSEGAKLRSLFKNTKVLTKVKKK